MQIEAGKFYTTRDGRRVGPISNTFDNQFWPFKCDGYYFKRDGFSCPGKSTNHRDADDLIAEWAESARFKVGDRVVLTCDNGIPYYGRAGEFGTITKDVGMLEAEFEASGTWFVSAHRLALAPATNPDATSVPGDIVEVVADRYDAVPVGSLGRVTASVTSGRHVRMCDDGLSYVFALDEIAKTHQRPEYEYAAGDAQIAADDWNCMDVADAYESDLRDDIAAETLALIIENEGADIVRARDHAETAYAYADAFIAARAA